MWDLASARAYAAAPALLQSELPVLGTSLHALTSPLPYGLGIYSVRPDGERQARTSAVLRVTKAGAEKGTRFESGMVRRR